MWTAWAFLKRDFLIATSYKFSFALQLLRILALVPIYFYIGRLVPAKSDVALQLDGGDYFAFLLVGMAFLEYLGISLYTFEQSLRDSQVMGTLEIMLLAPTSLAAVLIYSSLWVYVLATIRFGLYLGIGALYGLELQLANLPVALLILFLAVLGFAGFGMLSASITVVAKRGVGLSAALSLLSLVCGGVLFPTQALPDWLQGVAALVPITHALQALRLALFRGTGVGELLPHIAILLTFAAVFLPLGLLLFWRAVRHTKKTGTLAQY